MGNITAMFASAEIPPHGGIFYRVQVTVVGARRLFPPSTVIVALELYIFWKRKSSISELKRLFQ